MIKMKNTLKVKKSSMKTSKDAFEAWVRSKTKKTQNPKAGSHFPEVREECKDDEAAYLKEGSE